jgi:hypothetical protein
VNTRDADGGGVSSAAARAVMNAINGGGDAADVDDAAAVSLANMIDIWLLLFCFFLNAFLC